MPKISIIIPCYYNEKNIPSTVEELLDNEKLFANDVAFEYIMVDDGSGDNTLQELKSFKAAWPEKVKIVKLSGNFGSYIAILAGMNYATGDCNVVIAADLQDPPALIKKMYDYWKQGFKLILANREERKDKFLDRLFSSLYHRIIKRFAIRNMPEGGFDFCFFDKKLRDEVIAIDEKNTNTLFLLVWLKYDFVSIPYTRQKRTIGKSRWTFRKKLKLVIDSFVAFSYFPIRLISVTGLFLGFFAIIYAITIFFLKVSGHIQIKGWASLIVLFLFISAFQMIAIGIIGEYLWRNLEASRKRPTYVVEEIA